MSRLSLICSLALSLVGSALVVPAPALADPPDATRATYLREVHQANERLAAGQTAGAETVLSNALGRMPDAPEAHCTQGALQMLQGQPEQALETFGTCHRLAVQASANISIARALQGKIMALLALPGRIDDARAVAIELLAFAQGHESVIAPVLPRTRVQAIDLIVERDAAAADVRSRREARARENAAAE